MSSDAESPPTEGDGLDAESITARMAMIGLQDQDGGMLRAFWPQVEGSARDLLEQFYARLVKTPELTALLGSPTRVSKLLEIQQAYLRSLFCDTIDADYVARRIEIGRRHHELRVTPQWYLASCAHLLCGCAAVGFRDATAKPLAIARISALTRRLLFDASLALDSYGRSADRANVERDRERTGALGGAGQSAAWGNPSTAAPPGTEARAIKQVRVAHDEVARRAEFLGLDAAELQVLPAAAPLAAAALPAILRDFYQFLQASPALSDIAPIHESDRLMKQVAAYWRELFRGQVDALYAMSRMRIGVMHEQIGLALQWYLAGLGRQVSGLLSCLAGMGADAASAVDAFLRLVFFDTTFVLNAYMEARAARLGELRGFAAQVMRQLTSAVLIVDQDSRILFANEAFLSLSGVDPGLLYLMKLRNAMPALDLAQALKAASQGKATRVPALVNLGERTFRVALSALEKTPTQGDRAFAVVLDDVTEIVRAGAAIEERAQCFQRLADVTPAVLWEMDWETQTIVAVSRGTIDLCDRRDVTLLGRPGAWADAIVPEDQTLFADACDLLHAVRETNSEYRMVGDRGRLVHVRSQLTRVSAEGAPLRIAAVTMDVTQGRHVERLRMASLEACVSNMRYAIDGSVAALRGHLAELQSDKRAADVCCSSLNQAVNEANRLSAVLASLASFSGRGRLQVRDVDVNAVLEPLGAELQVVAGAALRLEVQLAAELPRCRLDPDELLVALSQLIDNARCATSPGGRVVLRTCCRRAGERAGSEYREPRSWVELSVTDDGCGMPEHVRRRAMEPFYSTAPRGDRLGLGLSIVYGYVAQCGGFVTLRSAEGAGTAVTLHFPASSGEADVQRGSVGPLGAAKVLAVHGDRKALGGLAARLETLGCRVIGASTDADALDAVAYEDIDVIVYAANADDDVRWLSQALAIAPTVGTLVLGNSQDSEMFAEPASAIRRVLAEPISCAALRSHIEELFQEKVQRIERWVRLSPREREVLQCIATGRTQAEVGGLLGISERTVEQHVKAARVKLNAVNTIDAVVQAIGKREIVP